MTIDKSKLTPMMRQYFEIKENYMDYILFYRLGDFYEMFFDDAIRASRELEITLTARNCGLEEKAPLCGVPYHAVDGYIKKLVEKGIKIAICEQTEDPALAKGLVKREVVRIITPGTITEPEMLDEGNYNYVAAVGEYEGSLALAYCDITTGLMKTTQFGSVDKLIDELIKVEPSELIFSERTPLSHEVLGQLDALSVTVTPYLDHAFQIHASERIITRILNVFSVESVGFVEPSAMLIASGALLAYVEETAKVPLNHFNKIDIYSHSKFMVLDKFTRRNLELVETMRTKDKKGSLLWVLDKTCTAMGARRLKAWVEEPLIDIDEIQKRLSTVEVLVDDLLLRSDLRTHLKQIYDLERLTSKLVYGSINPRDLIALKQSIFVLPEIKGCIDTLEEGEFETINADIDALSDIYDLIDACVVEEPPYTIKDGGVIKTDYHPEIATLRDAVANGKNWILEIEQSERERTGIKTLKVGFNKVFGYYIEISKGSAKNAPETYIRKQTLANAERFITPELKQLEETVLGAEEKIVRLEQELFSELKQNIMVHVDRIQKTARAIASLDALLSFAECSYRYGFVKPKVTNKDTIQIKNGRHPVIERIFNEVPFVPNDTLLDQKAHKFYIITGPNMAGKSTYLRQVALITLIAQIGCFVPAEKAEIGVVDRIFTRVGASDDLSQGQSTFMVEMNELANILNNATSKSLIILDEIGRGTSTYDGLSIAWSVVEYLSQHSGIHAKTMFATHYHELTELEGKIDGVCNFRISVKESRDDIIFLRKIERGGANQSFGIQVAKLAGVPDPVIERAKQILAKLEINDINNNIQNLTAESGMDSSLEGGQSSGANGSQHQSGNGFKAQSSGANQISEGLYHYLDKLEVEQMTPIEAMNALYNIVNQFKADK
ncbi:MAG: DNA mismatch repair protein MutS [Clostridiales bacterium 38-18]|nr:MAG: DNA mismatch repair protein MutS [Clostridiales bacterium 38-18]